MNCIIHTSGTKTTYQRIDRCWDGGQLEVPFLFCFFTENGHLQFRARREAAAVPNPIARPGVFTENLWKYDVMEFFLTAEGTGSYLEFNLAANGAWWAAAFTEPRVPLPGFDVQKLRVSATGQMQQNAWECEGGINLAAAEQYGWWGGSREILLCACAVLVRNGNFRYLSTTPTQEGKADFHRPWDWIPACFAP